MNMYMLFADRYIDAPLLAGAHACPLFPSGRSGVHGLALLSVSTPEFSVHRHHSAVNGQFRASGG